MSDVPEYSPSTVEIVGLVARLLRGETDGWVAFDARFRGFVLAAARDAGLREHDAEDLYQELALRLPAKLLAYTPEPAAAGGFRKWLAVVVRNMAIDFLRLRANRDGWAALPDEAATAERLSAVIADELDRCYLAEAVDRLLVARFQKPWVGAAWRLFWLDDLTPDEVATRVGVGYETVVKTFQRVRVYLADNPDVARLARRPDAPPGGAR